MIEGFDYWLGQVTCVVIGPYITSMAILSLPVIQVVQLSITILDPWYVKLGMMPYITNVAPDQPMHLCSVQAGQGLSYRLIRSQNLA